MAVHSASHLNIVAVVGGKKVRANQQEDDIGFFQFLTDLLMNVPSRFDPTVMPGADYALTTKSLKVLVQLLPILLIGMRIGNKWELYTKVAIA